MLAIGIQYLSGVVSAKRVDDRDACEWHRHADGRLLGAAIAIPRDITSDQRTKYLGNLLVDKFGRLVERQITSLVSVRLADSGRVTLDSRTWVEPGDTWTTVTPIAMHRWPKGDEEAVLADACRHAGFPEPVQMRLTSVSPIVGVPHVASFLNQQHRKRFLTHATIRWSKPVAGPVVIGAGRYSGYGFLKQWKGQLE